MKYAKCSILSPCKMLLTSLSKHSVQISRESLGLKIDENLTWKRHIDEISKKVSAAISALKRIRSYISQDTAA
jgi:hypothetical protein